MLIIKKFRKEIVFLLDLFIILIVSLILYYILQKGYGIYRESIRDIFLHIGLLIICGAVSQYIFKTYDSLWRYAGSKEYLTLILGGILGYTIFCFLDYTIFASKTSILFTLSVYSISLLGMLLMRLSYRQYRKRAKSKKGKDRIPIVIIGAGDAGVKLQEEVGNNPNSSFNTLCFIDDSVEKIGKLIHNIEVKGPIKDIGKILQGVAVSEIIIAMPSVSPEKSRKILQLCSSIKCRVRILPDTLSLLHGNHQNLWSSIREMRIEELLGREQITLEYDEIKQFLYNKTVLVTGGGGSIGSELCRQIALFQPKCLVIVDNYENNAYEIQQELQLTYGNTLNLKIEIATIRDRDRINRIMKHYRPNILFHAAAHKHVPLMEECPEEAIKNNILGTYNVVQAADRYKVDKFVQISTDKAVNPTSIMGASKRFCEMILQSMKNDSKTEFVAVRFGNVLCSNGSVVPLFQKQIARGGPVTITDKRIVRYFMTISEAVQLVLQAGAMANNSEIYVLDMGQAVKIIDLAENLIRLSGYLPYSEIPIMEIGLRPGEKLYEELLMNSDDLTATTNNKIFIEQQEGISKKELEEKLEILKRSIDTKSSVKVKEAMRLVVPTYREPQETNK